MDDVSAVFLTLTNATTIVYCIVYVLIAISVLELRKHRPEMARPYRIGKKGNAFVWVVSLMLLFSIVVVTYATLRTSTLANALLVAAIAIVMFVIPLVINHFKKNDWKVAVSDNSTDHLHHSH